MGACHDMNLSKLDSEWRSQSLDQNPHLDSMLDYWLHIIENPRYTELPKPILMFLSLPFSNAVTERIFSCLKNIKSVKRNRLCQETLTAVMCTKYGVRCTKDDYKFFLNNKIQLNIVSSASAEKSKELRLANSKQSPQSYTVKPYQDQIWVTLASEAGTLYRLGLTRYVLHITAECCYRVINYC